MPINLQFTKAELKAMKREKGSKLLPFKQEIHYLRKEGVSFSSIQAWLVEKNVDSSIENIRQFFERYKHEFSNVEFQLKDATIPDDEDYTYDNDQKIPDNIPF